MADNPKLTFPPGWLVKANVVKHPYIAKELYDQGVRDWRQAPGKHGKYGPYWVWTFQVIEHPELQPGTEVVLFAEQAIQMRLIALNPQVGQTVCFRKGTEDGNKSPINVSLLGGEPQGQQMPSAMPQQGYQPPPQAPPAYLPPPPPSQQPAAAPPMQQTNRTHQHTWEDIMAVRQEAIRREAQAFDKCGISPSPEALTSAANAVAIAWRECGKPPVTIPQQDQPRPDGREPWDQSQGDDNFPMEDFSQDGP